MLSNRFLDAEMHKNSSHLTKFNEFQLLDLQIKSGATNEGNRRHDAGSSTAHRNEDPGCDYYTSLQESSPPVRTSEMEWKFALHIDYCVPSLS